MKNIIINGAYGRMGSETVKAIEQNKHFKLVAKLDRNDNLTTALQTHSADIIIDFTTPACVFENTMTILNADVHPVIGTTGLTSEQIQILQSVAKAKKLGGVIAPNFSIGAVLMMQYSTQIAKYYHHVEIIELHHDEKKDAPSGTAIKTAAMMKEIINNNIPIHSVRLPGLVAHQEVIFGGIGETLTIRHDTINREAFMPGVMLACEKVLELNELVYGLESLL